MNEKPTKPLCKICDSPYHYQSFCPRKERKPIKVTKPLYAKTPIPIHPITKRKKPKGGATERQKAIARADKYFSQYIRLRDSINGTHFKCIVCGKIKPISQADCGHFISRRYFGVRWVETNAHAECVSDNRNNDKHLRNYTMFMYKKYGVAHVQLLNKKAQTEGRFFTDEINQIADMYLEKIKELQNIKKY